MHQLNYALILHYKVLCTSVTVVTSPEDEKLGKERLGLAAWSEATGQMMRDSHTALTSLLQRDKKKTTKRARISVTPLGCLTVPVAVKHVLHLLRNLNQMHCLSQPDFPTLTLTRVLDKRAAYIYVNFIIGHKNRQFVMLSMILERRPPKHRWTLPTNFL